MEPRRSLPRRRADAGWLDFRVKPPGLSGEIRAEVDVEVSAGSGRRDDALPDREVAEALARSALLGVALEQGGERRDDLVVPDVPAVQLVEA